VTTTKHAGNQGQRSIGSKGRMVTNGQMDVRYRLL